LEDSDDVLEIAEWHLAVSYIGNKASSTSLLSNLFTLKVSSTAMVDEIGLWECCDRLQSHEWAWQRVCLLRLKWYC